MATTSEGATTTTTAKRRYVRRVPNSRLIEEYFIESSWPVSSSSPRAAAMVVASPVLLGKDTLLRIDENTTAKVAMMKKKRIVLKRSTSETNMSAGSDVSDGTRSSNDGLIKSRSSRNLATATSSTSLKTYIKNRNPINIYDSMPNEHMPPLFITNQDEVKRKFLESNVPPVLKFKGDNRSIKNIMVNYSKPSYTHFFKAKEILDEVKSRYPTLAEYYEANFGKRVSSESCVDIIGKYLSKNKITGEITINFAPGLTCSGRIASYGSGQNVKNKPETRKFLVWINNDKENQFLRRKGIVSLCDHEIGTHYYRAYNDGLQIWYGERDKYGLRALGSNELLKTEEGLAALHTLFNADLEYLFLPALLYYLVCMASRMTFEQLFNHMEKYIEQPAERWKLVTRVKRGISDPHTRGCYSRDQAYFEGAVEILQRIDSIDFVLLMSGKLCLDELDTVRRLARLEQIKTPEFLKNLKSYKNKLRQIATVNGIVVNKEGETVYGTIKREKTHMASYEIERYINNEIVPRTKSTIDIKQQLVSPNETLKESSLCVLI